jgi:hypothetical protein
MSGILVLLLITFIAAYLFNSFEIWILKNKIKDLKTKCGVKE